MLNSLITFTYTKPDGSKSSRELFVTAPPKKATNFYFGYDLSEFSEDEKDYYYQKLLKVTAEYNAAIDELNAAFNKTIKEELGLSSCFKKFLVERMSDITEV